MGYNVDYSDMKLLRKLLQNGPLLIIFAAVLWAMDGIIRRSLFVLPPIVIVFYEHLIGLIILSPFILKNIRKERLSPREWLAIGFVSLLSGLLGTLWFTQALVSVNFISFSVVYLLLQLEPIFATSTAVVLLKEKVTKRYVLWAALALVATHFAIFKNGVVNFETGSGTITAALFALGASFAWGTSTAFSRYVLLKKSDVFITGIRFLLTTIFAGIAVLIFAQTPFLLSVEPSQVFRFTIIALSTGMVALFLYYKGLKKTEAKITTLLELVFPVLAVAIDAFLYKSFLSPQQYLAAAILLYCIYNISKLQKKKV